MERQAVRQLLLDYRARHPGEVAVADRFLAFVDAYPDVLHRTCLPGHVTASCWILSPDGSQCLLTLHRKLGRWLQLGGHVDGEPEVWRAALREAQEESGMRRFDLDPVPIDIDIHEIPARGDEPAHLHHDVRFLLRAHPGQEIAVSAESLELAWIPCAEVSRVTTEESVLRLLRKTAHLFQGGRAVDNA